MLEDKRYKDHYLMFAQYAFNIGLWQLIKNYQRRPGLIFPLFFDISKKFGVLGRLPPPENTTCHEL